jgi:hypothetical protein
MGGSFFKGFRPLFYMGVKPFCRNCTKKPVFKLLILHYHALFRGILRNLKPHELA